VEKNCPRTLSGSNVSHNWIKPQAGKVERLSRVSLTIKKQHPAYHNQVKETSTKLLYQPAISEKRTLRGHRDHCLESRRSKRKARNPRETLIHPYRDGRGCSDARGKGDGGNAKKKNKEGGQRGLFAKRKDRILGHERGGKGARQEGTTAGTCRLEREVRTRTVLTR